jgi:hypothetical protein
MEGNYREQKCITLFLRKEGVKLSDIRHLKFFRNSTCLQHSVQLGIKVQRWYGTIAVAVHKWYQDRPTEWFYEAIQKLPRRWQ